MFITIITISAAATLPLLPNSNYSKKYTILSDNNKEPKGSKEEEEEEEDEIKDDNNNNKKEIPAP